jgi:integrase/recombinase XerD
MRSGLGMVGPLTAFAPGFSVELVARGYRPRSAAAQMALMADVSRWLADHGLDERDLSEARVVDELMAHRRVSGSATLLSSRAMVRCSSICAAWAPRRSR